jgi:hypothetical protein
MDIFDEALEHAENIEISEVEQLKTDTLNKESRWKEKRKGKITSSKLPDLMKGGRGKGIDWGETAKEVLYAVKYERRTGLMIESKDFIKNFQFGKEHEPAAIAWLRKNGYPDIIHSEDQDDIIFRERFGCFGDSPDFEGHKLTGEIKCNVSQSKFESLLDIDKIHDKSEYYDQLMGHFIGNPEAEKLVYCMYDAYNDEGHVVELFRKDHQKRIDLLTERIKQANEVVEAALRGEVKICDINEYLSKEE